MVSWTVLIHPDAEIELSKVPGRERVAIDTALDKLRAIGPSLGYPHTSNIQSSVNLRELRPRQGRSAWRAFYRRIGHALVLGAVGPEATVDAAGFNRAVRLAEQRLDQLEGPHEAF